MGQTTHKNRSRRTWLGARAARLAAVAALAGAGSLAAAPSAQAANGDFTGALTASASTVKMGSTFTMTESAINLGSTQVSGITVGIPHTAAGRSPRQAGHCSPSSAWPMLTCPP